MAEINDFTWGWALNLEGRMVHVNDVERGRNCNCTCHECGADLISRQGEINAWHFAHAKNEEYFGAAESALHLAAKEILYALNGRIHLPEEVIRKKDWPDPLTKIDTHLRTHIIIIPMPGFYIIGRNIRMDNYDYVVNDKFALQWVMDQQCVKTDRARGIINDANDYANETVGDPRYPLEMFHCVNMVSLETMKIVRGLPELDIDV